MTDWTVVCSVLGLALGLAGVALGACIWTRGESTDIDAADAARERAIDAAEHALNDRARRMSLSTDQFEAMTHCPSCGAYGPHLMREPRRATAADMKAWEARHAEFLDEHRDEIERVELRSWGSRGPVRVIDCGPTFREPRPIDETEFVTIRICECGKEWGQK
ncbi:hypothetical protein GS538_11875 [Rhodococcus hoagii]|nr:hypothetical protein [Prescottella equi]NKV45433.1 hypothetical protein [Prescottella equi]NKV46378.1 hypothetical protein [Prescottella equi]